jgi:Uma2 family endonuclease
MSEAPTVAATPHASPSIPPLENGDHLTRPEFERRYHAMPHLKKAELLEGIVYIPSPVPSPVADENHGEPHFDIITWLGMYRMATPGVRGGDNSSLILDLDNEPQPDALLRLLPEYGGQSRVGEGGYLVGAPEFIAEVAASSASYDLHEKKRVYRRVGVKEYLVWRVLDRAVDWFVQREGKYLPLSPGEDGVYRSEVFPGLWLDAAALIHGDLAAVGQVLQQGLTSPEHQAFVRGLRERAEQ